MSIALSIVIPAYNEADNLPALLARFDDVVSAGRAPPSGTWELVVVDNGSTDDTAGVLSRELPGRPFARTVRVPPPNVGYGDGILAGLRAAGGRTLAWTHADGQTPPADVFRAYETWKSARAPERTFVKGSRSGRPLKEALFTAGMSAAAWLLLRAPLVDINAQPKVFDRGLLLEATDPPLDLSLDLYFYWLAIRSGFEVITVPVRFGAREHGQSKWATTIRSRGRAVARTLRAMVALRATGRPYRPSMSGP